MSDKIVYHAKSLTTYCGPTTAPALPSAQSGEPPSADVAGPEVGATARLGRRDARTARRPEAVASIAPWPRSVKSRVLVVACARIWWGLRTGDSGGGYDSAVGGGTRVGISPNAAVDVADHGKRLGDNPLDPPALGADDETADVLGRIGVRQ